MPSQSLIMSNAFLKMCTIATECCTNDPHLSLHHARALDPHQQDGLLNINVIIPACKDVK